MKLTELRKLNEIRELNSEGYFVNGNDIVEWMTSIGVLPEFYEIDKQTLEVSVSNTSFMMIITGDYLGTSTMQKLPIKFSKMAGSIRFDTPYLKTLRGLPDEIEGRLDIKHCLNLTNFDSFPIKIGGVLVMPQTIKSLVGISKRLKEVGYTLNRSATSVTYKPFICDVEKVKEGGIELILIEGITQIFDFNGDGFSRTSISNPWSIISKHLGKPDEIFECQSELIDVGFEEYAKL